MIYTEQTNKALKLCYQAHHGQVDKAGIPYVFHPIHLAEQMTDEETIVAALLHDVMEDTAVTLDQLKQMGFAPSILEALSLLTHQEGTPYQEYVRRLSGNPIARAVKIADLRHNMDETRTAGLPRNEERVRKYQTALQFLLDYENAGYRDAIRGSLIGGAAGDALGYEVEFISAASIFRQFGPSGITDYVLHNGLARISDDTQMTMFTANGLLSSVTPGQIDTMPPGEWIYEAYLDWLETQMQTGTRENSTWLMHLPDLNHRRAPGNTCLSALISGKRGTIRKPLNHSYGCGGVMRVAPIGLFYRNQPGPDREDRIREIMTLGAEAAAITHGHPLGYIPAAALVHIVSRVVYGGCPYGSRPNQILRECKELITELFSDTGYDGEMNSLIELAEALAENKDSDVQNIHLIGGGWVGNEALAIAVYCWVRYSDDFDRALVAAVNHSGDADSTGAILGNIMGAKVGFAAMDDKWKENLELYNVLLELADDLSSGCPVNDDGICTDKRWRSKYLDCTFCP